MRWRNIEDQLEKSHSHWFLPNSMNINIFECLTVCNASRVGFGNISDCRGFIKSVKEKAYVSTKHWKSNSNDHFTTNILNNIYDNWNALLNWKVVWIIIIPSWYLWFQHVWQLSITGRKCWQNIQLVWKVSYVVRYYV